MNSWDTKKHYLEALNERFNQQLSVTMVIKGMFFSATYSSFVAYSVFVHAAVFIFL